jgi:hypothetical protein
MTRYEQCAEIWQDAAKAVERLIEQALSPKSDRLHRQLRSEEWIHPSQEREGRCPAAAGGSISHTTIADTVDNHPPNVDESK